MADIQTSDNPTAQSQNMDTGVASDLEMKVNKVFERQAKYKMRGTSFGNKLVTSLPILNAVIPAVFLVASYIYAMNTNKAFMPANQTVPFISDIGNDKPQSSLFTFGMVLSSYCTLGIVLVRFWQVQHFLVKLDETVNIASLVSGFVFIFGKILVVAFQLSSQKSVHFVGAGLYVIFSTTYGVIQTLISYKNKTLYGKYQRHLILVRIVLVIGMILGTVIFGIFLIPSLHKYNREGYSVSQSGEWLFATCKICFMLTFIIDFWPLHPQLLLIKPNQNNSSSDLVFTNMAHARVQPVANSQNAQENGIVMETLKEVPE